MTDVTAPIELPTTRRSFVAAPPSNTPNVHDRNWIPVLDATNLRNPQNLDLTLSISDSLYSFPKPLSRSSSSIQRLKLTQTHSQSSLTPDGLSPEPGEESPKARTGPKKSPLASTSSPQAGGQDVGISAMPGTGGSGRAIEEQYYVLPDVPVSKGDIHPPLKRESAPLSPSINPPRPAVFPPTSKYNRKPVAGTASTRPPSAKSQVATLSESPKSQPALPPPPDILNSPQAAAEEASPTATTVATPKLSSKPSAAERRVRNGNVASPKSALSLFTQFPAQPQPQAQTSSVNSPSSSDDTDIRARPLSTRHKSRKSNDSRTGPGRGPIYDSTTPTPAPTTPLPQLPPKPISRPPSVKRTQADGSGGRTISSSQSRPSSSHASIMPQVQSSSQAPPPALPDPDTLPRPTTNEHVELTEFMSRRSTVIFRRFDDVHVKLLFCLQDEIAQLEEELGQLEAASATDRTGPKMIRVMRDLRKVVAEYDHLFANWAQMQANKVPGQTLTELREWLERPSPSGEASIGAKEDYKWVEEKKGDLSIC
ncbi:hypothetical protein DV735_g4480, partial [Chaetothyriales sp. CBS 134920]